MAFEKDPATRAHIKERVKKEFLQGDTSGTVRMLALSDHAELLFAKSSLDLRRITAADDVANSETQTTVHTSMKELQGTRVATIGGYGYHTNRASSLIVDIARELVQAKQPSEGERPKLDPDEVKVITLQAAKAIADTFLEARDEVVIAELEEKTQFDVDPVFVVEHEAEVIKAMSEQFDET